MMAKITSSCKICGKPFVDGEIRGDIDICRDCYRAQKEQKAIETIYRNGNEIEEIYYREYKTNYANCETIKGSYNAETKTIKVVIPRDPAKLLNPLEAIDWLEAHTKKW